MLEAKHSNNKTEGPGASAAPQAGFSLIEIVVAMVVMAIMMTSVMLMFTKGRGYIRGQADRRVALSFAQQRLEEIDSLFFDDLVDLDITTGDSLIMSITETPPYARFNDTSDPLDGSNGMPDYSFLECETKLEYVDVILVSPAAWIFETVICSNYPCDYIRANVTVSLTDVQKATGHKGYFADISLEKVVSDWSAAP